MHVAQVRQVAVVDCATPVNQSVNAGCFWLAHVPQSSPLLVMLVLLLKLALVLPESVEMIMIMGITELPMTERLLKY